MTRTRTTLTPLTRTLVAVLVVFALAMPLVSQTPPSPAPPQPAPEAGDKKADPKDPEKAEQEPRPVSQEQQKQEAQSKDAPRPAPQPTPAPAGAAPGAPAPAVQPEKKEEKWDVANPPGPSYDVNIDVREGTWMSLDVSPDGREIAFDLLGDIYVMPIGGGEARAFATGIQWDMQPRYSPNGRWIAFTSDRSGGDNIWTMNRDGSEPSRFMYQRLSPPLRSEVNAIQRPFGE